MSASTVVVVGCGLGGISLAPLIESLGHFIVAIDETPHNIDHFLGNCNCVMLHAHEYPMPMPMPIVLEKPIGHFGKGHSIRNQKKGYGAKDWDRYKHQ